ncbi:HAD domain-containing protein [Pseudomonas spirodelae]|uniref:HAD domain-containing protein n=1 Tax=Pseudomonas spirodelae TaxID=3101751 RepID=UPI00398C707C
MTAKKVVVFLDFDGALHPVLTRADLPAVESQPFCYLPRFAQVMRDFPDAEIFISRTWRLDRNLERYVTTSRQIPALHL